MHTVEQKWQALLEQLSSMGGVVVAYSGGVDSTFLANAAFLSLGDRAVAVTGVSPTLAARELEEAKALASAMGIRHELVSTSEWENPAYRNNGPRRCFYCKGSLFSLLAKKKDKLGLSAVVDGTNVDDLKDTRPGMEAAAQFDVGHPLLKAGFTKQDIRQKSKELGLPTWNKGSFACLASRIPKGKRLTLETIKRVEKAEDVLAALGFVQYRVRDFGNLAKLEVGENEIGRFRDEGLRRSVRERLNGLGYRFIHIDPRGYRDPGIRHLS